MTTLPDLESLSGFTSIRYPQQHIQHLYRLCFNQSGKLSGADMVVYLLEKSRLTYQQPLERCYHAFYNLMSDQVPNDKYQHDTI